MKSIIPLLIAIFCLSGTLQAQETDKDYVQLSEPVEQTEEFRVFGSSFNTQMATVPFDSLLASPAKYNQQTVTTEGEITQVCQKKGCFFMLQTEDGDQQARISFKDYSFFVPTNTAGAKVKLNGTFNVKTISEEDAKHYAEDAGEDPSTIKGPQKEFSLVATSVMIFR